MKLITLIIVSLYILKTTVAIRVPTAWPLNKQNKYRPSIKYGTVLQQGSEIGYQSKPYGTILNKKKLNQLYSNNRYNHKQKNPHHPITNKKNYNQFNKLNSNNDWVPMIPQSNGFLQVIPNFYTNVPQNYLKQPAANSFQNSPVFRNYRDDKTHEPTIFQKPYTDPEPVPKFERNENENAPISEHEEPLDVPTRPIYPGEGQWAKKGKKFKLFISPHKSSELIIEDDDSDEPEGYEVFKQNDKLLFNKQQEKFRENLDEFPIKHKLGHYIKPSEKEEESEVEESGDEEFTPVKMYAQVRRSESEQHLPQTDAEDERLREVVKDSKIQTVYTEEGYEDIAYDHAGHEKNAEEDEGSSEFEKDEEKKKLPQNSEADSAAAGSEYQTLNKPNNTKMKKNNFITTKETKTTAVKDKGNGTTEMEISSEIKVLMTPNNSTKAHKYVKIYPKVYRYDRVNEIEETTTLMTTTASTPTTTNSPIIQQSDAVVVEIPLSTPLTTAFPEIENADINELEVMESIRRAVSQPINKIRPKLKLRRRKRYTNDFPKIEVDTVFIDKIKHDLPVIKKQDLTAVKYPYYNNPRAMGINQNSPLRYSEDLENIPQKTGDDLAFYQQADAKLVCPEVESEVNPIPERIQNAETNAENNEETTDVQDLVEGPRLNKLGDKIDCFKMKYFGENPLDSPIFKEEIVGPVENIFNLNFKRDDRQMISNTNQKLIKPSENEILLVKSPNEYYKKRRPHEVEEFLPSTSTSLPENPSTIQSNRNNDQKTIHPDVELVNIDEIEAKSENRVEIPVISIITTPKYTIDLTPKNIYDQIQLLQYLPIGESPEVRKVIVTTTTTTSPPPTRTTTTRAATTRRLTTTTRATTTPSPTTTTTRKTTTTAIVINQRQPKIMTRPTAEKILDDEVTDTTPSTSSEDTPESQALIKKRRRMRPRLPQYHIFDINKFLPQNPFSQLNHHVATASNNVPIYYKPLSEVHYKNEIKPNEQLNVFADVINNIKNSTNDPLQASATQSSDQIAVKLNTFGRVKVPPRIIHMKNPNNLRNIEKTNSFYLTTTTSTTTTTTTARPLIVYPSGGKQKNNQYNTHKNNKRFYEDLLVNLQNNENIPSYDNIELMKINKKENPTRTTSTTTTTTTTQKIKPYLDNISSPSKISDDDDDDIDYVNTPTVIGLEPPKPPSNYPVIHNNKKSNMKYHPSAIYKVVDDVVPMNNFYVHGMKPPSAKQKVMLYSDYKLYGNNIKRKTGLHYRNKRNVKRQSYSKVTRNRNKPIDDQADEELVEEEAVEAEEDDYVPHRSRNYYYDEKTGRIVYNNNNKKEKEEEEELDEMYEEITEKILPKPSRRLSASTTPSHDDSMSEPSFIDFIMKLKSSLSYHEIPDPTTTKKSEMTAVTEKLVLTTPKPTISTKLPEFLNILSKVRSDSNYKVIEDRKSTKATTTTSTTTTTTTTEAANFETAEESQVENVQNSPGGQLNPDLSFRIFDINDYLPKIKNYIPKTAIDVSKYKTIERPSVALRHNLSSRYNSEEEIALEDVNTSRVPILLRNEEAIEGEEEEEERKLDAIKSTTTEGLVIKAATTKTRPSITTTETTPITTTMKRIRLRVRTRVVTTEKPIIAPSRIATTTERITEHHDKLRRTYPRRRPGRIKLSRTTEQYLNDPELENPTKILHRRHQPDSETIKDNIPVNDATKTEQAVIEERMDEDAADEVNKKSTANPLKIQPRKLDDVQVFNQYDKTKKHGGNYRREHEESGKIPSDVYIFKKYNETNKHGGNYRGEGDNDDPSNSEVIESRKISQVEVYKTFDETKDDDDDNNYKREIEDSSDHREQKPKNSQTIQSRKVVQVFNEYDQTNIDNYDNDNSDEVIIEKTPTKRPENLEIFKNYDQSKKHGGNYRRKNADEQRDAIQTPKAIEQQQIEVFKQYDQTKKHGGNYRRENQSDPKRLEIIVPNPEITESQERVEVFKEYDKKHGGINYRKKEEDVPERLEIVVPSLETVEQNDQKAEVFKAYDKTKKHGGNYRKEDSGSKPLKIIVENSEAIPKQPQRVEVFKQYDKTKKHGGNYRKTEESEPEVKRLTDIVPKPYSFYSDPKLPMHVNQLKEVGVIHFEENQTNDEEYNDDEVKINFDNQEKLTKKPIFVKDPSKRLYYYAPV